MLSPFRDQISSLRNIPFCDCLEEIVVQERFAIRVTLVEGFHGSALIRNSIQASYLVQDSASVRMYRDACAPRRCYDALIQEDVVDFPLF